MRVRKTVSFKDCVFDELLRAKGVMSLSTFLNDHFEKEFKIRGGGK